MANTLDERPQVTIRIADLSTDPNEVCLELLIRGADETARNNARMALLVAINNIAEVEP